MLLELGIYLVEKTINPITFKRYIESSDRVGRTIDSTIFKKSIESSDYRAGGTIDTGVPEISSIITSEGQLESEDGPKRASSVFYDHFGNPIIKLYYDKNEPISQREGNKIRMASFEMIEEASVSLVRYREHNFIKSYFVPTKMGRELIKNRLEKNADMYWKIKGIRKGRCPRCNNHAIVLNENFLIIQTRIDTKGLAMETDIIGHANKLALKPKPTTADIAAEFNKNAYNALVETYEHLKWLFFKEI